MRMRYKPYARPELAAWEYHIDDPTALRGRWATVFAKTQPLWLELGCGKGDFAAELASRTPDVNLIAVDIKSEVLVVAKRTIERVFAEKGLPPTNIRITAQEIGLIDRMLAPEDRIERIFINFCNPWDRSKQRKRRLTYPHQLRLYRQFLADGGQIRFKTDDDPLFADSLKYFAETGFRITYRTDDLAASDFAENIPTEHEKMFTAEGRTVKFLIAEKLPGDYPEPEKPIKDDADPTI